MKKILNTQHPRHRPGRGTGAVLASIVVLGVAALTGCQATSAGSSASPTGSTGPLSMPDISISSNFGSTPELSQIALGKKYYQANGLNSATIVGYGTTVADQIALVLGGHAQFVNGDSSPLLHAKSSGSDIVSLMNIRVGGSTALVVKKATATKLGIPSANSTTAEVKKQLQALKGSHLEIGVPSATGDNAVNLVAIANELGLTTGSSASDDITITALGSQQNTLTAFGTGKVNAFSSTAPSTYLPDTVYIPLYKAAPVSQEAAVTLSSTGAFIKAHPDVVQATVDSYLMAMKYAQDHQSDAVKLVASTYQQAGATPDQYSKMFDQYVQAVGQPVITKKMFQANYDIAGLAGALKPISYASFVDNSFVIKGIKQLGLNYPTAE
ncbi:MAG TPA: ABC transporter substrate-binding protein [Pseudolysinimonas sp.]|jgi:ABC-type nitrate/sulfonate/bicarbonate transport system substrate-binding protein